MEEARQRALVSIFNALCVSVMTLIKLPLFSLQA